MESIGYTTLWSSGGFESGLSKHFERLLAATTRIAVASGIVSIWTVTPTDLAAAVADLETRYPGRFLAGLGASHATRVVGYARPFSQMVKYLDDLDVAATPLDKNHRILAALGPRMLELSRERSLGAHPYFVPAEYVTLARATLGPHAMLAPSATVVLESDVTKARQRARAFTEHYLSLPNYANNLRSLGYSEADLSGSGSNRLVDSLVCWGTLDAVAAKLRRYFEAGADHVCIQVLSESRDIFPSREYRELASALANPSGSSA